MKTIYLLLFAAALASVTSCTDKTIYYRRTYSHTHSSSTLPGQPYQLQDRSDAGHFRAETER